MQSTMGRFRANSLTSSSTGSSRPSTPNNSILFDLLTQKDSIQTNRAAHIAVMTNPSGYRNCLSILEQSLEFIFQQNELNQFQDDTKIEIIEKNWLWVFLIELAMSNIEVSFGEMEIILESQNKNISNFPTKDTAKVLANCLNSIRIQRKIENFDEFD